MHLIRELWPKLLISYDLNYLVVAEVVVVDQMPVDTHQVVVELEVTRASGYGPSPLQGSALPFSNLEGGGKVMLLLLVVVEQVDHLEVLHVEEIKEVIQYLMFVEQRQ